MIVSNSFWFPANDISVADFIFLYCQIKLRCVQVTFPFAAVLEICCHSGDACHDIFFLLLFIVLLVGGYRHLSACHSSHVEARRQFLGVGSLLTSSMGSGSQDCMASIFPKAEASGQPSHFLGYLHFLAIVNSAAAITCVCKYHYANVTESFEISQE